MIVLIRQMSLRESDLCRFKYQKLTAPQPEGSRPLTSHHPSVGLTSWAYILAFSSQGHSISPKDATLSYQQSEIPQWYNAWYENQTTLTIVNNWTVLTLRPSIKLLHHNELDELFHPKLRHPPFCSWTSPVEAPTQLTRGNYSFY